MRGVPVGFQASEYLSQCGSSTPWVSCGKGDRSPRILGVPYLWWSSGLWVKAAWREGAPALWPHSLGIELWPQAAEGSEKCWPRENPGPLTGNWTGGATAWPYSLQVGFPLVWPLWGLGVGGELWLKCPGCSYQDSVDFPEQKLLHLLYALRRISGNLNWGLFFSFLNEFVLLINNKQLAIVSYSSWSTELMPWSQKWNYTGSLYQLFNNCLCSYLVFQCIHAVIQQIHQGSLWISVCEWGIKCGRKNTNIWIYLSLWYFHKITNTWSLWNYLLSY